MDNTNANRYSCNFRNLIKVFAIFYLSLIIFGLIVLKNNKWFSTHVLVTILISIGIFVLDVILCAVCAKYNWFERINRNNNNWYQTIELEEITRVLKANFLVTETIDSEHSISSESTKSCKICMEEYENINMNINFIRLSCDHDFCEKCIATWTSTRNTCPICRTEIISEQQLTIV